MIFRQSLGGCLRNAYLCFNKNKNDVQTEKHTHHRR